MTRTKKESGKKRPASNYRAGQKRDIHPGGTGKKAGENANDHLAFVVPWQISDNEKYMATY